MNELDEGFFKLSDSEDGLKDVIITEEGIRDAITGSKNGSPGCDGITPFILKKVWLALVPKLKTLFDQILHMGIIPDIQRFSLVIPLLKGSSPPSDPSSYRPIHLTSILSRVLETLVKQSVEKYLERKDTLSSS